MAKKFKRRTAPNPLGLARLAEAVAPKGRDGLDLTREVTIIPIGPGGKVKLVDDAKPLIVDAKSAADVIRIFNDRAVQVPLDWEHSSVIKAPKGEPSPAAGWITALRYDTDRGLMATIEFTATAAEMIDRHEYKYLSPTVIYDKRTRRVRRLHSVALTNTPAIHHMVAIAASDLKAILAEDNAMPEPVAGAPAASPEQMVGEIKAALEAAGVSIAPDATLEGVLAAVLAHLKSGGAGAGEGGETTAEHPDEEEVKVAASVREALKLDKKADSTTVLKALRDAVTAKTGAGGGAAADAMTELREEVKALTDQLATGKTESLIALAESTGHINAKDEAQYKWAKQFAADDPSGFEGWMTANKPTSRPPQGATRPPVGMGFRAASDAGDPADMTAADQKLIRDHCVTHKCSEGQAINALQQTLMEPLTAKGLRKDAAMAQLSEKHPYIFMGCDDYGMAGVGVGAPPNAVGFAE